MAQLIIQLRRNPQTGKHDILVKLHSDPDALPLEHERLHREQVAKLLGRDPTDLGELIITRESEQVSAPTSVPEPLPRQPIAQKH
ncbi:MAG: hypothetical protein WHU94_00815 [Thermogemmata sp.]|jgi:hypothetical protein|uniref:FtsH ternary system domain-containing protein n=1 Tax=Thermogemmata fonticola TaxID=2755323 RepID=A0A7V8VBX6_9BACT|nr:hypothetical protein [Thermogemmata fonticola]MBA2225091.1 hypothetical protein [Thermogemmata fonticola]MCX8139947.1 hypothetical protein [Gemmataceae bacterium]GIW84456.1 MAG: hypothetical protein KatS3mg107_0116 [Gemmataceae bacterium]